MKHVLITAALLLGAGLALAQGYPNKPIKIVVPFTAGSATDIMARIVGEKLSAAMAVDPQAEVDAEGRITRWRHEIRSNGHGMRPPAPESYIDLSLYDHAIALAHERAALP